MYTCLEPCFLKACCIVHLMWNAHTVSSHSCYTCLDPIVLEVCVTMAWSRILPWAFIAWLQVAEVDLQVDFSERQFLSIGLVSQSLAICKLRSERQKVRLFLLAWNLFSKGSLFSQFLKCFTNFLLEETSGLKLSQKVTLLNMLSSWSVIKSSIKYANGGGGGFKFSITPQGGDKEIY